MTRDDSKAYFERVIQVLHEDIGELEHVKNAVYLSYIEACARVHAEHVGLSLESLIYHGVLPVVKRHDVGYHRPARLGDELLISTAVIEIGGPTAVRRSEVRLAATNDLLVEAVTEWVWLEPSLGRPKRVPQAVVAAFGFPTSKPPEPSVSLPAFQADLDAAFGT